MRPSRHETMLEIVQALEKRTTCIRRGVGCVLTNARGEILSTGYNGVARGEPHCNKIDNPVLAAGGMWGYSNACPGQLEAVSGSMLHECKAIHAEQNALLQCKDVQQIYAAYISCTPCIHCVKLLMNTSCELIVAFEVYNEEPLELWTKHGNRDFIIIPRK